MLSLDELNWIESLGLSPIQGHQLRLLAHGLRTLQRIAGRRQGAVPALISIESWVKEQPQMAEDADFAKAFVRELASLGVQFNQLAKAKDGTPLGLELADLLTLLEQKLPSRPDLDETDPNCDHRSLIPAPSP